MAINDVDDDDIAYSNYNYDYPTVATRGHEAERRAEGFEHNIREGTREKEWLRRTDMTKEMASWAGHPAVKGSTETMRMVLLTFSLIGLQ